MKKAIELSFDNIECIVERKINSINDVEQLETLKKNLEPKYDEIAAIVERALI